MSFVVFELMKFSELQNCEGIYAYAYVAEIGSIYQYMIIIV